MAYTEPKITINGVELDEGQAITLRVAITVFLADMAPDDELGSDEHGRTMVRHYRKRSKELLRLLRVIP